MKTKGGGDTEVRTAHPVLGISNDAVKRIENGENPFSLHSETTTKDSHEHMIICIGFHSCPLELAIFHDIAKGRRALEFLSQNDTGRKGAKKFGIAGGRR